MHTRTGSFPIGFRRGWSAWQKDLPNLIAWAGSEGFRSIDTGPLPQGDLRAIRAAGLDIGTVDLACKTSDLVHPDAGLRKAAAEQALDHARMAAAEGVRTLFCVVPPAEPARPRRENFAFAVDGFGQLCQGLLATGQHLAIEGWPGGAPHYPILACTPADYRALLGELPSSAGINFDPSHLVRMGIDCERFAAEFLPRIHHVHAKDTELLPEGLYEHGNLQSATFAKAHGFGGHHWRYCIPGHGAVPWSRLFARLHAGGFRGTVSIELEDENFNTDTDGEQRGLRAARDFLHTA
jgi:sugar phosphate isomerase/epimerase